MQRSGRTGVLKTEFKATWWSLVYAKNKPAMLSVQRIALAPHKMFLFWLCIANSSAEHGTFKTCRLAMGRSTMQNYHQSGKVKTSTVLQNSRLFKELVFIRWCTNVIVGRFFYKDQTYVEAFERWCYRRLSRISWTNETEYKMTLNQVEWPWMAWITILR